MTQFGKSSLVDLNQPNIYETIEKFIYEKKQCFIDKYKIINELGSGAYARVYRCITQESKQYALKIYSYAKIKSKLIAQAREKMIIYINQEAKLLQQCQSRHIVKCYQTIESHHYKILVLEYCSNETLWQYLFKKGGTSKCLKESEAIGIIKQVSLGLIELHKHNIIHRDLKLQNITIRNGICKIIDLGLSRQLENQSNVMGTNAGTDQFIAPEVKKNKPYGLKADIFSLGIIYLILISDCSLEKRSAHNFYNNQAILFSNPQNISPESLDFIDKTIQINPYQRLSWRELLSHKLFTIAKTFTQSEINFVEENFKAELNRSKVVVLDCSELTERRESRHGSKIFVQEQIQGKKLQIIAEKTEQLKFQDYNQDVQHHYLNCKKAEFILFSLLDKFSLHNKIIERQFEAYSILMYLLSLKAINLVNQGEFYFKVNKYEKFQKEAAELKQAITIKFQYYKSILDEILKNIKNAFVKNQILKNYQPLKQFLLFDNQQIIKLEKEHLNLISYYIQKLAIYFNAKTKATFFSFLQVMMITLSDLRTSDFETRVAQICMMNLHN